MFNKVLSLIMSALIAAGVLTAAPAQTPSAPIKEETETKIETKEEVLDAMSRFSMELWAKTASDAENTVLSPASAWLALAMTANGAKNSTVDAFSSLGCTGENRQVFNETAAELLSVLTEQKGSTVFEAADSIWVDDRLEVDPDMVKLVKEYFMGEAIAADLPRSVARVNSWIEEHTNGMIRDMLSELDEATVMLLINTLYMKAKWRSPFTHEATYQQDFYPKDGEAVKTDFMHKTASQMIVNDDDLTGIVLPYDDDRFEFVALMPDDNTLTLPDFIRFLGENYSFKELIESAEPQRTVLSMPKFEVSTSQSLVKPLMELGFGEAFDPWEADLSGLGRVKEGDANLYISDVLQNARLILDEEGTEAAAATVVMIAMTTAMPTKSPFILTLDRPFVWAVVEKTTGAVVFCGEYNAPGELPPEAPAEPSDVPAKPGELTRKIGG